MRNITLIILFASVSLFIQGCYTSGYTTLTGNYFKDFSSGYEFEQRLDSFKRDYFNLMLDTIMVDHIFSKDSLLHNFPTLTHTQEGRQQFGNRRARYPMYPITDYFGLQYWCILSPPKDIIFYLGLFNCKIGHCKLALWKTQELDSGGRLQIISYDERLKRKQYYIHRFEEEILPLLKPYFEKKE